MPTSYRAKGSIGYIAPPRCNETLIEEALAIRPPGLAWCFATLGMADFGERNFTEALSVVEETAAQLAERGVDMIVYSGVPLTATQDGNFHGLLEQRIADRVGTSIPIVTDSSLVLRALHTLSVRRVSLITPYRAPTVAKVTQMMEANGLEVADSAGKELSLAQLLTDLDDDSAFDAAMKSFEAHPDTDGFYLSCPQWPVVRTIQRLEKATGKPVVTQLQAMFWWARDTLGIDDEPAIPLGRLMDTRPTPLEGAQT